ncbi:unnamed protein product [Vicia faba]|uniref:Tetratricopeptide repeat protein 27 homolog n=1 Tax=Vicia faba TaxID=3906 RepID=A0AAV0ZKG6_VICFA|nr:unnamed protein product [Vicia faba]
MSNLEADVAAIRGHELRLIRCTLSPSPATPLNPESQNESTDGIINNLLASIESGNYAEALTSPSCRLIFQLSPNSPPPSSADTFYSELVDRAESFITDASVSPVEQARRSVLVLCIAVAAFLGFTQCNFTGPLKEKVLPRFPLPLVEFESAEWDIWARNYLMSDGSDLLGKFSNLQYIVFAKMLLMRMKDLSVDIRSLTWWLGRVLLLEQRILDERSSTLFDLLHAYMGEALQQFGTSEQVQSYWEVGLLDGESSAIVSLLHLEAGIMEYVYGRVDPCRTRFESAEMAAGLQLSVTGALGFRTIHQVEPKAQMVLVACSNSSNSEVNRSLTGTGIQTRDCNNGGNNLHQHQASEASDILVIPKLVENTDGSKTRSQGMENGAAVTSNLTAMQQAVVLAHCLLIEKSSRHDELQRWDMAPFIEAIDSQQFSYFIIRCFCDILRIRWESLRSRTKERALLMMDNLVKRIYESSPEIAERIPFSYGVYMASIPALRKEYGELLVRCGLIGEAIKEFDDLELWDNLIHCYSLLEKKALAVDLIKKRLLERPNDPRLWCSLGDISIDDACYKKALEVSNSRSARAKRSLARSAYNRGDYDKSKVLWESAMSMNSMYPDGWFAFGAAALKARDVDKALDAFTRAVQLDPENGEAWNNIACLHLIKKKSKEAYIAFKEALKFKRNSWQLWENYSHVAVDVGNTSQALEGAQMVLNMTKYKRVDTVLLERITNEVEKRFSSSNCVPLVTTDNKANTYQFCTVDSGSEPQEQVSELHVAGRTRETEQLISLLGNVLQQIVKNGSGYGPEIWGLYSKWHRIKGDLTMCSEALLKQVRSLQSSDTWNDRDRFQKFAKASLELCKVYVEISASTGSMKELFTAEMHLKNICRQGQSFSDTEEFKNIQVCLDEVKIKLQSNT